MKYWKIHILKDCLLLVNEGVVRVASLQSLKILKVIQNWVGTLKHGLFWKNVNIFSLSKDNQNLVGIMLITFVLKNVYIFKLTVEPELYRVYTLQNSTFFHHEYKTNVKMGSWAAGPGHGTGTPGVNRISARTWLVYRAVQQLVDISSFHSNIATWSLRGVLV